MAAKAQEGFNPLSTGVQYRREGDMLILAINIGSAARDTAQPSQSGKMRLLGTTHGFVTLPDSDVKVSLNVGTK